MDVICKAVFHLPSELTFTACVVSEHKQSVTHQHILHRLLPSTYCTDCCPQNIVARKLGM